MNARQEVEAVGRENGWRVAVSFRDDYTRLVRVNDLLTQVEVYWTNANGVKVKHVIAMDRYDTATLNGGMRALVKHLKAGGQ